MLATRPADLILIAALAAFPAVGGLLSHRHPLAWLLIAEGFAWQLGIFCDGWVHHGGPDAAAWVLDWIWMPAVALIPVLLLLFPDGRPPSRRWWLVVALLPVAAPGVPRRARLRWSCATGGRARSSGGSSPGSPTPPG